MDFINRYHPGAFIHSVSEGIRTVSQNIAKIRSLQFLYKARKTLLGIVLLISALGFGLWAHDLARSDALWDWEHHHFPSSEVWTHGLGSRGYRPLQKQDTVEKLMRIIPAKREQTEEIWISENAEWVAIFTNQDQAIPMKAFCRSCQTIPNQWEPLGSGWVAFDQTLSKIDQSHSGGLARVKTQVHFDPREIHY